MRRARQGSQRERSSGARGPAGEEAAHAGRREVGSGRRPRTSPPHTISEPSPCSHRLRRRRSAPSLADYPYDTVPNKVEHLFFAQLYRDQKQRETRMSMSRAERAHELYVDYLKPIITDVSRLWELLEWIPTPEIERLCDGVRLVKRGERKEEGSEDEEKERGEREEGR